MTNLAALLTDHPFGGSDLLVHGSSVAWTKGEVERRVAQVAGELRAAGVGPGHGVAVVCTQAPDVVIAMLAAWSIDAVFIPVNPLLPEAGIAEIVDTVRPACVLDDAGITTRPDPVVHPDGVAFVQWTSGTTGRPKPVLHTHDAYLELLDRVLGPLRANATAGAPAKPPSPNLIPVSISLNAGIYNALFGLRAGAPIVVMDRFTTTDFATLVNRHQIRSTVLPPAAMAMLSDDHEVTDLTPLRYVRSITAPLSPFQARRFTAKFGVTVLNGYGQAEMGEVIGWTAADAKNHPDKIGAIGKPHPNVSIRIDAPDGNGVGELLVRPPSHAAGYADGTDLDDRMTADGFIRTGDLARIDDEGFVWIEGRLGDLINRGGNKIFPSDVEEVLLAVPGRARGGRGRASRRPAGRGACRPPRRIRRRHGRRPRGCMPGEPRGLQGADAVRARRRPAAQRGRQGPAGTVAELTEPCRSSRPSVRTGSTGRRAPNRSPLTSGG